MHRHDKVKAFKEILQRKIKSVYDIAHIADIQHTPKSTKFNYITKPSSYMQKKLLFRVTVVHFFNKFLSNSLKQVFF